MTKSLKSDILPHIFDHTRNMPNVLKLIVFGDKDNLVTEDLLSEKAIFYCYKKKLDPEYEKRLKSNYEKIFGKKVENVQERFIYDLEGGVHVLHMQKKLNKKISKAIEEYIGVLDAD